MTNVHSLKPGELGVIAHTLKSHSFNAWEPVRSQPKSGFWHWNDIGYELTYHIPHGAIVMILKEIEVTTATMKQAKKSCYQILYNETIYLVSKELLFCIH